MAIPLPRGPPPTALTCLRPSGHTWIWTREPLPRTVCPPRPFTPSQSRVLRPRHWRMTSISQVGAPQGSMLAGIWCPRSSPRDSRAVGAKGACTLTLSVKERTLIPSFLDLLQERCATFIVRPEITPREATCLISCCKDKSAGSTPHAPHSPPRPALSLSPEGPRLELPTSHAAHTQPASEPPRISETNSSHTEPLGQSPCRVSSPQRLEIMQKTVHPRSAPGPPRDSTSLCLY